MEDSTIDFLKDQKLALESRILELNQNTMTQKTISVQIQPDYDLYQDEEYLYLNVNLPGVLKQELKVKFNQGEITIGGEFPNLCSSDEVDFLERQRPCGVFEKKFLLPPELILHHHEWQLVDGVLQIRMILNTPQEPSLLSE